MPKETSDFEAAPNLRHRFGLLGRRGKRELEADARRVPDCAGPEREVASTLGEKRPQEPSQLRESSKSVHAFQNPASRGLRGHNVQDPVAMLELELAKRASCSTRVLKS